MSDQAMREMTADEWAAVIVGKTEAEISVALKAAEGRGYRRGRQSLEGAVHHFETAYRYASGALEQVGFQDSEVVDKFESAKTMAKIAYEEWHKDRVPFPKPPTSSV